MNHGRFFSLDLEVSRIEEGISVFNYTDIFDDEVIEGKGQTTPRYPIFVSITSSSVKFILQYCVYLQLGGDKKFTNSLDAFGDQRKYKIHHMEEVLVELPISPTSGLSLAAILKRLHTTPFPIDIESNYILELVKSRYEETTSLQYKFKQDRDKDDINYSSLFVWGLYKDGAYLLRSKEEKEEKYSYNKVLRKLVLDFFFDMMHSNVFKNSVHYDTMYSQFMSDYFCSSIIRKSEFYYQRSLVNDRLKDYQITQSPDPITIYAENLDQAEKRWVECIQSSESDRYFDFKPNWFECKEDKGLNDWWKNLKNVIKTLEITFSPRYRLESLKKMLSPHYEFKICNSWFASPEEELRRVYYPINNHCISCSSDLYSHTKSALKMLSADRSRIQYRKTNSAKWALKRYSFIDAYRISFFHGMNTMLIFLLMAIVCHIVWHADPIWIFVAPVVIGAILLGKETYYNLICKDCGNLNCNNRSLQIKSKYGHGLIFARLWYKILHLLRHLIDKVEFIIYPRLVASITAAWLTIALSEDLYKAFFDIKWSVVSVIPLLGLIFIFVVYEVHKIVPIISFVKKALRAVELMLIGFVISLLVGTCVINFTGERMLVRSGILPEFYRDNVLVRSDVDSEGNPTLKLNFEKIDTSATPWDYSRVMNFYTRTPTKTQQEVYTTTQDSLLSKIAIHTFASTAYEKEYADRIAEVNNKLDSLTPIYNNIDSLSKIASSIIVSDTTKGMFLLRHENDLLFKDLLEYVEHTNDGHSIASFHRFRNEARFFILYDFLIQFAAVAMFIGIFIQMIFEEKNVTES